MKKKLKPTKRKRKHAPKPRRFHVDRRAAEVAAQPGSDDDLLTTPELAEYLGCSTQWVEIGRSKGYGPEFERVSRKMIRYRRGKVRKWLDGRSHGSTAEY
jgi:hypothetical protein